MTHPPKSVKNGIRAIRIRCSKRDSVKLWILHKNSDKSCRRAAPLLFATEDWVRERTGRCILALTVYHALSRVWDGPLALPRAVAQVYLDDPDTLPIHRCEACGYRIPTYAGPGSEQREVYFTECPLCGGRIRWELMRMSASPVGPDGYPLRNPGTCTR